MRLRAAIRRGSKLAAALESRGRGALAGHEDGSIFLCSGADGKEVKQGVLSGFPTKAHRPKLAELLKRLCQEYICQGGFHQRDEDS